jgi:RHS repeat-associated protein
VERGFAGRPLEGASGLVYLRARHYDPATGRFLQPDPLGLDSDQLYAYARSNPYVYRDPTGLLASRGAVNNVGGIAPLGATNSTLPRSALPYLAQDVGPFEPGLGPGMGRPRVDLRGGIRPPGSVFATESEAALHGIAHSFDISSRTAYPGDEVSGQIIRLGAGQFTYRVYTEGRRGYTTLPRPDLAGVAMFHIHTAPRPENEILSFGTRVPRDFQLLSGLAEKYRAEARFQRTYLGTPLGAVRQFSFGGGSHPLEVQTLIGPPLPEGLDPPYPLRVRP